MPLMLHTLTQAVVILSKKAKALSLHVPMITITAAFVSMLLLGMRPSAVSARMSTPSLGGPSYARVGDVFSIPYYIDWVKDGSSCMLYIGASYTSSLVSVTSIDGGNYPCGSSEITDNNPGTVNFLHSDTESRNPPSGAYNALKVTFRARATGTFTYTVGAGSYNNYFLPSTSRSFTIHPTNCPSGQVGTPPNCSSPAPPPPSPQPTPTPAPTPPPAPSPAPAPVPNRPLVNNAPTLVIPEPEAQLDSPWQNGPKVEGVTFVTGITAVKGKIITSGGVSNAKLIYIDERRKETTIDIPSFEGGSADILLKDLSPSNRYQYRLTAIVGEKNVSYEGSFSTRGFPVELIIKQGEEAVGFASFTVNGKVYKTNKDGIAPLDLPPGEYRLEIGKDDNKHVQTVVVKHVSLSADGMTADKQVTIVNITAEIAEDATRDPFGWIPLVAAVIFGLLISGIAIVLVKRRKNKSHEYSQVLSPRVMDPPNDIWPTIPQDLQPGSLNQPPIQPLPPKPTYNPPAHLNISPEDAMPEDIYETARKSHKFDDL